MIINVRGTSGSGKTTLARRVMALYPERTPYITDELVLGKKRAAPLWYDMKPVLPDRGLRVLGAYEAVSGGADGISGKGSLDYVARLAEQSAERGIDVFYEGLVQGSDMSRLPSLAKRYDVLVIVLSTSIDDCLASVRARREAKGNTKPLDETSTRQKHTGLLRSIDRLRAMGVRTEHLDREAAYQLVVRELGL